MQTIKREGEGQYIGTNAAIKALRVEFAEKFQTMAQMGGVWNLYAVSNGLAISQDPTSDGFRRADLLLENVHCATLEHLTRRLKWKLDDRCPTVWIDRPRDCALHKLIAEKLTLWPENIDMLCVSKRSEWMFRHRVNGVGSLPGQLDRAIKELGRCSPLYRGQYCTEEQFLAMKRQMRPAV